jgi:5'-3' exonuclease
VTGRLLAVDGNSLAHRAYYAYERRGDRTPDGRPLWAVYGFLSLLIGVVNRTSPDAVVVGFDDRTGCARRNRYPGYKGGRPERSEDLYKQLDALPVLLGELGVTVAIPAELEADDVLASASAAAEHAGWECVLATSDKDAFGLITRHTTVMRLMSGGLDQAVRMTPEALLAQYQVTPAQWRDYTVLTGDKSDNLPGVLGIGEKTAVKLLTACGSLDAALADPDAALAAIGGAGAAKLKGADAAAAIARNRDLMTPVTDVPVIPERCRLAGAAEQLVDVLRRWHLSQLADRAALALCPQPVQPAATTAGIGVEVCSTPECAKQVRLVTMDTGELAAIAADPDPAGTLGWAYTPAGWRMRRLGPGEQPHDRQHRRWTAHECPAFVAAGLWDAS